jgi:hypothetical protein
VAVRLYNGGYYYPVSFSNTGPVTASSTSPNYISNRTSPGVGNENGRWEGRAGNAAYSSGIRSFVASGQPGVDRVSAAIFTSTYTSSMQTAIDRLIVDDVGRVTIPNQPCWVLRPGGNSNETLGSNPTILGWTSSGGFMQGVSLSASSGTLLQNAGNAGRINVPVSGRYALWVSVRLENNPTAGQIWVRKNGVDLFRQHVEVWGRFPYGHAFAYHVASASAGDYFEVVVQSSTGVISGTNDTVNWFSGHLLG